MKTNGCFEVHSLQIWRILIYKLVLQFATRKIFEIIISNKFIFLFQICNDQHRYSGSWSKGGKGKGKGKGHGKGTNFYDFLNQVDKELFKVLTFMIFFWNRFGKNCRIL